MNILYSWMTIAWNWHFPTPGLGEGPAAPLWEGANGMHSHPSIYQTVNSV